MVLEVKKLLMVVVDGLEEVVVREDYALPLVQLVVVAH